MQYIVIDTLGRGSYGKVKLCLNTGDDTLYAVKVVNTKAVRGWVAAVARPSLDACPVQQAVSTGAAALPRCRQERGPPGAWCGAAETGPHCPPLHLVQLRSAAKSRHMRMRRAGASTGPWSARPLGSVGGLTGRCGRRTSGR